MDEDATRILDNLRFTAQILGDSRRTLLCEPSRIAEVQAIVDERDLAGIYTVRGSRACPQGKIIVIDDPAMEASSNATAQRAARSLWV